MIASAYAMDGRDTEIATDLTDLILRLETRANARFEEVTTDFRKVLQGQSKLRRDVDNLVSGMEVIANELSSQRSALSSLGFDVSSLRSSAPRIEEKLREIDYDTSMLHSGAPRIADQVGNIRSSVSDLERNLKSVKEIVTESRSKLNKMA